MSYTNIFLFLILVCFIGKLNGEISCKDTLFTENEDEIGSPYIPRDSKKKTVNCTYDIRIESKWFKLTWQRFNLFGNIPNFNEAEFVEIYGG